MALLPKDGEQRSIYLADSGFKVELANEVQRRRWPLAEIPPAILHWTLRHFSSVLVRLRS